MKPFAAPKRYVCFDFDGTLANTPRGILETAKRVLTEWGLTEEEQGDVNRLIGPPFPEAFELVYGFSPEDAQEITNRYRAIYGNLGPEFYPLYEGVQEMLSTLKQAGVKIALTTSKQEELALCMSKTIGIDSYFDVVCGNVSGHGDKAELIAKTLRGFRLDPDNPKQLREVCMVGDRSYDILGAKASHIDSVGVTYGAGSLEELKNAGATRIAHTPAEVTHIVLGTG